MWGGGGQNPYIEEEQTTQWSKEKGQKDKRSTKHIYKTKDRVRRAQLKTGGELMCSGRVVVPAPLVFEFIFVKWCPTFVFLCFFTFLVLCCYVRYIYNIHIKKRFLPPVVCRRALMLCCLFYFLSVVSYDYMRNMALYTDIIGK